MAVLNEQPRSNLTLSDWAKRLDSQGKVDKIVEILNQTNPALQDIVWKEGNLPIGHKTTIRTGLPNVAWRKLYELVFMAPFTSGRYGDKFRLYYQVEDEGELKNATFYTYISNEPYVDQRLSFVPSEG